MEDSKFFDKIVSTIRVFSDVIRILELINTILLDIVWRIEHLRKSLYSKLNMDNNLIPDRVIAEFEPPPPAPLSDDLLFP